MKTLQINEANALRAYQQADAKGKTLLSNLFGEQVFSQNITDRVKTFEDACAVLGITPFTLTTPEGLAKHQDALAAHAKLVIIAEALNEGWTPDWDDSNEYKYFPYFDMRSGFSFYHFVYNYLGSGLGSRLCFKNSELAEYAGRQFLGLYKEYFTYPS